MNKEEFLKDLKFDKETFKKECWNNKICAICKNKADLGYEIRFNMHCSKCYHNYYSKIRKEKMIGSEARKFYKELIS